MRRGGIHVSCDTREVEFRTASSVWGTTLGTTTVVSQQQYYNCCVQYLVPTFLLAERDLALRGPGEVLGVRQKKGYIEEKRKIVY